MKKDAVKEKGISPAKQAKLSRVDVTQFDINKQNHHDQID